jgi:hypothetical protein
MLNKNSIECCVPHIIECLDKIEANAVDIGFTCPQYVISLRDKLRENVLDDLTTQEQLTLLKITNQMSYNQLG